MITKQTYSLLIGLFSLLNCPAQEPPGAAIPWTTYEAEQMRTTGTILGPAYVRRNCLTSPMAWPSMAATVMPPGIVLFPNGTGALPWK